MHELAPGEGGSGRVDTVVRTPRAGMLAGVALALAAAGAAHAEPASTQRSTAEPKATPGLTIPGQAGRLDFDFGRLKAWLLPSGEWHVEGKVPHRGLLCGMYEAGVRFGIGRPGCTDVHWLTADTYVTRQEQCNGATVLHTGGDLQADLKPDFGRITCAESSVRCVGNCK